MSRSYNKKVNNITRFGYFRRDPSILRKHEYFKSLCKTPELVLQAEKLGMISKEGYYFNGYLISKDLVGEMIYQLKMFFRWDCKAAYSFFRKQFKITNSNNELRVDYMQSL